MKVFCHRQQRKPICPLSLVGAENRLAALAEGRDREKGHGLLRRRAQAIISHVIYVDDLNEDEDEHA
jgi:hypothetical protein